MTSEVLIFNKRAVVLAADSAVTSSAASTPERPRYSKTATKIFELSNDGNVAVAIFAGASIDQVPWELAIKLFRASLKTGYQTVSEYLGALIEFLSGNEKLFPRALRDELKSHQFDSAAVAILKAVEKMDPATFDATLPMPDRQLAWANSYASLYGQMHARGVAASLSTAALLDEVSDPANAWLDKVSPQLMSSPELQAVNARQLVELAHWRRYVFPDEQLGYTGVVVAGYGADDIFPGYHLCHIHGHVGDELFWIDKKKDGITHSVGSLILPLAQKSMIDLFTDGFGSSLWGILYESSIETLKSVFDELATAGVQVPSTTSDPLIGTLHEKFMRDWTTKNWKENYHPLMGVLTSLSVDEMAHLAETLLVLQSLKERVTSSSESVGGPIDVAAITKSEGMVWLKRKHYFDADRNLRYTKRLEREIMNKDAA